MNDPRPHVLLLGGSTEAARLAAMLADDHRFRATLSLAGVTGAPAPTKLPCRIGGFGGVAGLRDWLALHRVAVLVDATHPFALAIGANARAAASLGAVPLIRLTRAAWSAGPGDRWVEVDDATAAARALGVARRRVLLTIGRRDLVPFRDGPPHDYLLRSVEAPAPELRPAHARLLVARGPFNLADERALFRRERIEILVTKNSGGDATAAKLEAARDVGATVVMIRRPPGAAGSDALNEPDAAMARLRTLCFGGDDASAVPVPHGSAHACRGA